MGNDDRDQLAGSCAAHAVDSFLMHACAVLAVVCICAFHVPMMGAVTAAGLLPAAVRHGPG
jgi:hypothetical protein